MKTAQEGSSEVLYGLGATLGRQGREDLALVYLQLAIWLYPEHPFASLTLADLYEQLKQPAKAIEVYETVPDSSPLSATRRCSWPSTPTPGPSITAQGPSAARGRPVAAGLHTGTSRPSLGAGAGSLEDAQMFSRYVGTCSRRLPLIPATRNWALFYFRGVLAARRIDDPLRRIQEGAGAQLPDQPIVAGISAVGGWTRHPAWTRAARTLDLPGRPSLRPTTGIVDSLGWAYYRTGRYEDAVVQLERTIELMPQDPVINDHLGDAYWKVGRSSRRRGSSGTTRAT